MVKQEVAGMFTVGRYKHGELLEECTFRNLITDSGLNYAIKSDQWSYGCEVGSGSSIPAYTDVALDAPVALAWNINYSQAGRSANVMADRPYVEMTRTYTFSVGAVVGNISEIAIWEHAGGYTKGAMMSRALIKDLQGEPTSIALFADEQLIVTYRHRHYINMTPVSGTFVLTGDLAGTYSYKTQPAGLTDDGRYDITQALCGMHSSARGSTPNWSWSRYVASRGSTDFITPFTSTPVSPNATPTVSVIPYVGEARAGFNLSLGTTYGNFPGGIDFIVLATGRVMQQYVIEPPIMKTADDTLNLTFEVSWGRYEGEL